MNSCVYPMISSKITDQLSVYLLEHQLYIT
jgi:hypothetical protein